MRAFKDELFKWELFGFLGGNGNFQNHNRGVSKAKNGIFGYNSLIISILKKLHSFLFFSTHKYLNICHLHF